MSDLLCAEGRDGRGERAVSSIATPAPKRGVGEFQGAQGTHSSHCFAEIVVLGADADDTLEIFPKQKPEPV